MVRTRAATNREKLQLELEQATARSALRDKVFAVNVYNDTIASFLTKDDQRRLFRAIPNFKMASSGMETFIRRKSALSTALSTNGLLFTKCSQMDVLKKRLTRYFTYGRSTAAEVAEKIKFFLDTRGNKALRTQLLSEKMSARNLSIRKDSNFCNTFINGQEDVDPEEVVMVMALTKAQFNCKRGHVVWSNNHVRVERILREAFFKEGLSWEAALQKAEQSIHKNVGHYYYEYGSHDDDDSDGYYSDDYDIDFY